MKASEAKSITEAIRANNKHMNELYDKIRTEAEQGKFVAYARELTQLQTETLRLQGYQVLGTNDRNVGEYKISWDL